MVTLGDIVDKLEALSVRLARVEYRLSVRSTGWLTFDPSGAESPAALSRSREVVPHDLPAGLDVDATERIRPWVTL